MILNTERNIGFNEGIEQGKLETAKRMLDKGIPINTIMKITNLTKKQMKVLRT